MADTEKIRIVVDAWDNASDTLRNIETRLSNLTRGIGNLNGALRQYNSSMASVNRMMIDVVQEIGSAIYDFTSDSISNFSELSAQHAKTLGAMANDYDKTLESQQKFIEHSEKLKQQAIDLAKYGVNGQGSLATPVEVASVQTELVKAGVSADAMVNTNIVQDVLQFAQANQLDTGTAVEFAVSLGSQFKVNYEDWGDMLDKVSHTADMSIVDVKDIVASMKYAGGISSGIERPMEEVLGMISVLGNFGLKGSQAGSGIQALLTRLLTGDTTVISDAMAEVAPPKALEAFYDFSNYAKSGGSEITYDDILNETFTETDITGELRPMEDVIDTMETVMADLTDEEQAWFAKKLFGLYQMKSAYALINGDDSSDMALQDVIKEIEENSTGTNANKLAELLNSQDGQIKATMNLIEGIKTELGQMLEPTTLAVLHEVQEFLKDPGNYDINWDSIRTSLDESCDAIEQAYGSAISTAVRNLGGLAIDLGQVVEEIAPEFVTGILNVFNSLITGNIFGEDGVSGNWGEMINNMRTSLEGLPEDLQALGDKVVDVVDMFGKLAALNVATTIAQLVTSVLQIALMTVNAASVIVTGSGIGGGGGAGAGGASVSGLSGKTVAGSADDIARLTGTSADDVISFLGKKSKYTIDDIARYMGASTDDVINALGPEIASVLKAGKLANFGKAAGILGTLWQVGSSGYEAYQNFQAGDTKGGVEAISGGAGSLAGAWAGAKGGAALGTAIVPGWGTLIGGIGGAVGGALGGDVLSRWLSGEIYNKVTGTESDTGPKVNEAPVPTPTPPAPTPKAEPSGNYPSIGSAPTPTPKPTSEQITNPMPAPAPVPTPTSADSTTSVDWAKIIPGWNSVLSNTGRQDAIQNLLNNNITITPSFKMEAPQVRVEVTVDSDGKVTSQNQSILNPSFNSQINSWYHRASSQMGATTK